MRQQKLLLLAFLFPAMLPATVQSIVNTTGGTLTSPAGTFKYSVGKIAITTLLPGPATVRYAALQGVLQPIFKKFRKVCDVINAELLTYPNLATYRFRFVGPNEWSTGNAALVRTAIACT